MIRLVTISGEFASGGNEVAARLAGELGWALFDGRIIQEIAESTGVQLAVASRCDERIDSLLHRMIRAVWHAGSDRGMAAPGEWSSFDMDRMADLTTRILRRAGETGSCVLVGRGSQCLFQNRRDALHVFTYAPLAQKLKWVAARHPGTDAEALCQQKDHDRAAYVRRHFGCDWNDRHLYHLTVSTCAGEEAVTDLLLRIVRSEKAAHG